MQNIVSDFFKRMEHIVDTHYEGNVSAFSRDTGITRQYYNKMKRQYEGKLKGDPNPTLEVILKVIENTDVNPVWLLTGKGEPDTILDSLSDLDNERTALLSDLSKSDISADEKYEFLVKHLRYLLDLIEDH